MAHKVYSAIVNAVRAGKLAEPFSKDDFRVACTGLGHGTYAAFLDKHAQGNPGVVMIERTIEDIVEALRPHGAAPRRCSVLLGAGCSISAGIPSASDIVRQIEVKFPAAYARAVSHDYPDCMAALERGVRRDLLRLT